MNKLVKMMMVGLTCVSLGSCGSNKDDSSNTFKVVDMLNRTVEIENNPERFVCIGPGALRQYSYVGDPNKIVGIENTDATGKIGTKPYLVKFKNREELPIIGQGGSGDKTNIEAIFNLKADVIFTAYISNPKDIETLQKRTHTPVVALAKDSNGLFKDSIYNSLRLISKVIGNPSKGEEVVNFFENSKQDLIKRAAPASEESGYLGCVNFQGAHGIRHTTLDFPIFDVLNIKNAVDAKNVEGYFDITTEALKRINPDKMILDAAGLNILKEEMNKEPELFKVLDAFKKDEVYLILPTVYYSCNFDVALANAYYIGKIFYKEQFNDVDPIKKFNEISNMLYGENTYEYVTDYFHVTYGTLSENLK